MRFVGNLLVLVAFASSAGPISAQKQRTPLSKIKSAKTAYFDDQSGANAVGAKALKQLKTWGQFTLVATREQADVIFVLSASPYKGGHIILSGGQTGTIEDGHVQEDQVPEYNRASPVRYAYLTVIDGKSGQKLWSDSHKWGGLLTGFDSAGARLVKKLQKEVKK